MKIASKVILAALGAVALAAPAAAQFGGPPPPPNTGVPLFATLTGIGEKAQITVVVDPPKGTACYILNADTLEGVSGAQIRAGEGGQAVLTLEPPRDGSSGGCMPIAADAAQAMIDNPAGYTVSLTTQRGALSGQLDA